MPPERDAATLLDIVTAARLILEFKEGLDYPRFEADAKTQSAMIHQFLIIGEARVARSVPQGLTSGVVDTLQGPFGVAIQPKLRVVCHAGQSASPTSSISKWLISRMPRPFP